MALDESVEMTLFVAPGQVRNNLKFNFFRRAAPARDWPRTPGFDLGTADYAPNPPPRAPEHCCPRGLFLGPFKRV